MLSGVFAGDLAIALERAGAFCRILAVGAAFDADSVDVTDGPTVIRFPKGSEPEVIHSIGHDGEVDILARHGARASASVGSEGADGAGHGVGHSLDGDRTDRDLLIVSVGAMAPVALAAAEKVAAQGYSVEVVDPRWVIPVSPQLLARARRSGAVACA